MPDAGVWVCSVCRREARAEPEKLGLDPRFGRGICRYPSCPSRGTSKKGAAPTTFIRKETP